VPQSPPSVRPSSFILPSGLAAACEARDKEDDSLRQRSAEEVIAMVKVRPKGQESKARRTVPSQAGVPHTALLWCPYCLEQDIEKLDELVAPNLIEVEWKCRRCERVFTVLTQTVIRLDQALPQF